MVTIAFCALADPAVLDALSPTTDEVFDPEGFLRHRGTVYVLGTSSGASATAGLVGAFVEDITEAARRLAARSPAARLDPPLTLVLDEAANYPLPSLPSLMSDGGGSGICTVALLQSLAQARTVWGEHAAAAIWDAAIVKVILGGGSHARDLQDLSALLGEREEQTTSTSRGRDGHTSTSVSTHRVPILPPARLRTLPFGTAVLLLRSAPPIALTLSPWTSRPDAARLTADRAAVEANLHAAAVRPPARGELGPQEDADAATGTPRLRERGVVPAGRDLEPEDVSFTRVGGPTHLPSLTEQERAALLAELRPWVVALRTRFLLDHTTVPACWEQHPGMVEALAALRDAERGAYAADRASRCRDRLPPRGPPGRIIPRRAGRQVRLLRTHPPGAAHCPVVNPAPPRLPANPFVPQPSSRLLVPPPGPCPHQGRDSRCRPTQTTEARRHDHHRPPRHRLAHPCPDEELLRALLAQAVTAHEGVDLGDPADYWYCLGQRNAHAHAAGLLVAGPADPRRADAIADRITLLLTETTPTISQDELYAAAVAPYPPASVHPGERQLRWLEPKAWAAAHPHDPNSIDREYGSTWGPRRDTALRWNHQPHAATGLLYAHDRTWDEYAILADDVASRDVDAAYLAACRARWPCPARGLRRAAPAAPPLPSSGLPSRQPSRSLGIRR